MTMFQKILIAAGTVILAVILFGREKAWEGLQTVWQYFTSGAMIPVLAISIVAGCTADGGFAGSPHGMSGTVNTIWADVNGVPTIVPDGGRPMGYRNGTEEDIYTTYSDGFGTIATGRAAYALALAQLCRWAPDAELCGRSEPQTTLMSGLQ